jgi:CYTH domain-containing protein
MPVEIERKFLVEHQDWTKQPGVKIRQITQGYISKSKKHTVRIRLSSSDSVKEAFLTIKGPQHGITRAEYEYPIPYEHGVELLRMCDGNLIEKTRYTFLYKKNQRWEVDVFRGAHDGLAVAEIELDSEDTPVKYPWWVLAEVTFDKRYTNSFLSAHPIKS